MAGGLSVSSKGTSNSRWLAYHGGLVRRSPQRSCDARYAPDPTMFAKLNNWNLTPITQLAEQNNWNLTPISPSGLPSKVSI